MLVVTAMAWVLVWGEGRTATTVSGIATREACVALKDKMEGDRRGLFGSKVPPMPWACYDYPSIISTGDART